MQCRRSALALALLAALCALSRGAEARKLLMQHQPPVPQHVLDALAHETPLYTPPSATPQPPLQPQLLQQQAPLNPRRLAEQAAQRYQPGGFDGRFGPSGRWMTPSMQYGAPFPGLYSGGYGWGYPATAGGGFYSAIAQQPRR
ncbi:MAG: hypothetical protein J3K34DRAFT_523038 [Monoraphidium minutum]|nr:MAG: hypothetical protein J3K34DRAFT_523038 [Monoraphidium minutum]